MAEASLRDWRSYAVSSAYVVAGAVVAQLVNQHVTQPYLDEVFHIPQAQRYCRGEYVGYDPKLTTPPGLYALSVTIGRLSEWIAAVLPGLRHSSLNLTSCHTVEHLRQTALAAQLLVPWVLSGYSFAQHTTPLSTQSTGSVQWGRRTMATSPMEAITKAEANPALAAQQARSMVALKAIDIETRRQRRSWSRNIVGRTLKSLAQTLDVHTVALLPPMWFFGFLYYTDVPSTILVVGTLTAAKRQRNGLAAVLGAMSLTLRQTNIVWVLFAMGCALLDRLAALGLDTRPLKQSSVLRQWKSTISLKPKQVVQAVIQVSLPYAPVFIGAAAFVMRNGSIVLGDRENHQVSLHWVQPMYFAAFATLFAWPTLVAAVATSKRNGALHEAVIVLSIAAFVAAPAVHFGTVAHPFLLADNRHYAFYVWRKVLNRTTWTRYALTMPYAISLRAWWIALAQRHSTFWLLGFILCTCAALVPSPLIEPRYFLIPYVIVRLGLTPSDAYDTEDAVRPPSASPPSSRQAAARKRWQRACLVEASWAVATNAATVYLFLAKPFRWGNAPKEWQRFMW